MEEPGSEQDTGKRRSIGRFVALAVAVGLLPLALLAYLSIHLASDAVEREVEARVGSSASLSAAAVEEEMRGLRALVDSYAGRPHLVAALRGGVRSAPERRVLRFHLRELREARPGIYTTFVADPRGGLVDIVPSTPSIVGKSFRFRDWYRGVTKTGRPYVSEAYRTQAKGRPLVAAAASLVRDQRVDGARGRPLAIIVAGYRLAHIQRLAETLEAAHGVRLKVTDQRGVLVATPGGVGGRLVDRRRDPRVAAALAGRSGTLELDTPDGRRLSAYAPVRDVGWTVTASVPVETAFAAVAKLRSAVLAIAVLLALGLLAGIALLVAAVRGQQRAEAAARREVAVSRAVLDASRDAVCLVDEDGELVLANAAMERLLEEVLPTAGATFYARLAALAERTTDPDDHRAALWKIERDPRAVSTAEYELADSHRSFERYTAPVGEESGPVSGRIFTFRETTAEREAERMKDEFIATVSHELRTPLTSVRGYLELVREGEVGELTPQQKKFLDVADRNAGRLLRLVTDLLFLAQVDAGKLTVERRDVDLAALAADAVEAARPHAEEKGVSLLLDRRSVPLLVGDPTRLAQLLDNLLSNAVKFTPAGGSVDVRVGAGSGRALLEVADTGVGIPAEDQQRLFERFYRSRSAEDAAVPGTGLGLSIVRAIVHAHGGRISVESKVGAGTTFRVELPLRRPQHAADKRERQLEAA